MKKYILFFFFVFSFPKNISKIINPKQSPICQFVRKVHTTIQECELLEFIKKMWDFSHGDVIIEY